MREYRNRSTGKVLSDFDFRNLFGDTAFPDPNEIDVATLDSFGYDPVISNPPVLLEGFTAKIKGIVQNPAGEWVHDWEVVAFAEDIKLRTKEEQQEEVWQAIKAERDRRKAAGLRLIVDGVEYWFWTDDPSRSQYALLECRIQRLNLPDEMVLTDWKTMSGVYIPLTVGLLHRIIDQGIANESYTFHNAEKHRQAMLLVDQPLRYDYGTDWLPTYAERELSLKASAQNNG